MAQFQQEELDFAAIPQPVQQQQDKYRPDHEEEYEEFENNNNPYEELTDIPPDDENSIKPDFYIDRPPTPEYKPIEKGIDISTQIEAFEPELFDFVLEVEPILQVIVGKTIEQARMELIEEDEALALKLHKAQFEKKRNAELMVTQRMETAYIRRKEERERRQLQHNLYKEQMKLSQMKFISRQLSKVSLRGVKQRILSDLENLGFLRDDKMVILRQHSLPWFIKKILNTTTLQSKFSEEFQQILEEVQVQSSSVHGDYFKKEMDRRAAILAERERVRIEIEERKKRKAEIKRRRAIKAQRDQLKDQIEQQVLSKVEPLEHVFQASLEESIPESGQQKNYLIINTDFLLLMAQCLDFMIEGDFDQLDDQMIYTLIIDLLNHKLQQPLKESINNTINLMEQDPFIFNKKHKQDAIANMVKCYQTEFHPTFSNKNAFDLMKSQCRMKPLELLVAGIFDIYFKSINYKEPEVKPQEEQQPQNTEEQQAVGEDQQEQLQQEVQPEIQEQEQQVEGENVEGEGEGQQEKVEEEEYVKPEVTEIDVEMIEARKKINLVFKEREEDMPKIDVLVKLHIPYHIPQNNQTQLSQDPQQSGIEQEDVQLDENIEGPQVEQQDEAVVGKWDFDPKTIDIYDGEQEYKREGEGKVS